MSAPASAGKRASEARVLLFAALHVARALQLHAPDDPPPPRLSAAEHARAVRDFALDRLAAPPLSDALLARVASDISSRASALAAGVKPRARGADELRARTSTILRLVERVFHEHLRGVAQTDLGDLLPADATGDSAAASDDDEGGDDSADDADEQSTAAGFSQPTSGASAGARVSPRGADLLAPLAPGLAVQNSPASLRHPTPLSNVETFEAFASAGHAASNSLAMSSSESAGGLVVHDGIRLRGAPTPPSSTSSQQSSPANRPPAHGRAPGSQLLQRFASRHDANASLEAPPPLPRAAVASAPAIVGPVSAGTPLMPATPSLAARASWSRRFFRTPAGEAPAPATSAAMATAVPPSSSHGMLPPAATASYPASLGADRAAVSLSSAAAGDFDDILAKNQTLFLDNMRMRRELSETEARRVDAERRAATAERRFEELQASLRLAEDALAAERETSDRLRATALERVDALAASQPALEDLHAAVQAMHQAQIEQANEFAASRDDMALQLRVIDELRDENVKLEARIRVLTDSIESKDRSVVDSSFYLNEISHLQEDLALSRKSLRASGRKLADREAEIEQLREAHRVEIEQLHAEAAKLRGDDVAAATSAVHVSYDAMRARLAEATSHASDLEAQLAAARREAVLLHNQLEEALKSRSVLRDVEEGQAKLESLAHQQQVEMESLRKRSTQLQTMARSWREESDSSLAAVLHALSSLSGTPRSAADAAPTPKPPQPPPKLRHRPAPHPPPPPPPQPTGATADEGEHAPQAPPSPPVESTEALFQKASVVRSLVSQHEQALAGRDATIAALRSQLEALQSGRGAASPGADAPAADATSEAEFVRLQQVNAALVRNYRASLSERARQESAFRDFERRIAELHGEADALRAALRAAVPAGNGIASPVQAEAAAAAKAAEAAAATAAATAAAPTATTTADRTPSPVARGVVERAGSPRRGSSRSPATALESALPPPSRRPPGVPVAPV